MGDEANEMEVRYRIGMVARSTGLTTHTIRVWERRYSAVSPARSEAGGRLYTTADIERLTKLSKLVEAGHSIGQIARLADDELSTMLSTRPAREAPAEASSTDLDATRAAFLDAVAAADLVSAEKLLEETAARIPMVQLIHEIVFPIQQEIGRRWRVGELRIVQEHAVTNLFRNLLGRVSASMTSAPDADVAISCAPEGQHHELGALMAGLIAANHGYRIVHFGTNVPIEEIVFGVSMTNAKLVLLSITIDDAASVDQLEVLARELPDEVRLIVGGRGAPRGRSGAELLTDLEALGGDLQRDLRVGHPTKFG